MVVVMVVMGYSVVVVVVVVVKVQGVVKSRFSRKKDNSRLLNTGEKKGKKSLRAHGSWWG